MIQVKSLYKSFEGKDVLVDINATFNNGKTNLIIGQSGSGKTVLMKCIVGLLTPEKGEILYDGRNFLNMNKKEKKTLRREMGMIFQSAALFDSLTVLENVMFPLDMFSNDTYRDRVKRAQFCLDRVNLMEAQNKYPGEISGGLFTLTTFCCNQNYPIGSSRTINCCGTRIFQNKIGRASCRERVLRLV